MNAPSRATNGDTRPADVAGETPPFAAVHEINPVWLNNGVAVVEQDGLIVTANDTLAAWLGATPGELQGQCLHQLLGHRHAQWTLPMREFLARTALFDRMELSAPTSGGAEKLSVELCCHGDVRFIRFESELPALRDLEDGIPDSVWGRATLHKVQHRLLRAETQVENLFHHWPGIIFSQRPDFTLVSVSPKIEELTGVPVAEWKRQSKFFWQVVHDADADALMKRLKLIEDTHGSMTSTYRIRHIHTGRVTYLWEHRQSVRSSNGLLLGYEGIWLDITRQTIAERRLLTMSWKENLGTLTMGLAHDFCNIMTGIVSLAETFENELGENENLRTGFNLIRSTAGQASELAQRIRQLHQGSPGEKNYHDLNRIVSSIVAVLEQVLSRRVRVQSALDAAQLPVYTDAVELQQVIVNLGLNAVDAMPNGGTLTFRTSRHEQPPAVNHLHGTLPCAPLVCLSVQDTGGGIVPGVIDSIFDPFFTTKPLGKGSGLGLYNARLFAEKHGVAISVETGGQCGTTFHLWFAQTDFSEAQRTPAVASSRRHTILVMGQPEESRNRVVELLRTNAFYVVPAASLQSAVEALHSTDYNFSGALLLCRGAQMEELSIFHRIRAEKLPIRTFLSFMGCNQDEMDTSLLENVDAILPQELPATEFLSRLNAQLDRSEADSCA